MMMEKTNKSTDEPNVERFSLIQIVGLVLFLAGLGTVISTYLAFVYSSSIFLVGFVIGLIMLALGGSLVIYYEGRKATNETIN
ncbi:MAG: hypothetical protein NTW30_05945 [Candidatus Aenigmarchaeota archaeon]|nr:hypothetical protein [Candidatus Aenigmarchaeota archaeon]